jgi:hypothetical protein
VLDADYREQFSLAKADRALGPCMGQAVAQPWVNQGKRDGVVGTSVRNENGAAFYFRCDETNGSRGNALVAFSSPSQSSTDVRQGQVGKLKAFVGTRFQDLDFVLSPDSSVLTGIIYVVAEGAASPVREFLDLLGGGDELRLLNPDIGVNQAFSLSGSRRALEACRALY